MISRIVDNEKIHTTKAFPRTSSILFQILFLSKLMFCFFDEYTVLYNKIYSTLNCIVHYLSHLPAATQVDNPHVAVSHKQDEVQVSSVT